LFHSHPLGDAYPSDEDLISMKENELLLVYSDVFGELRLWKRTKLNADEQELRIIDRRN
jgi:proteasome lid subunit RPN8/RPN11